MIDEWSDEEWDKVVKKTGMQTVPQVYVAENLIGGYTQLTAEDAKGAVAEWK